MDGLRWLLLLFGLLVVAGVYLYSRREKSPADDQAAVDVRRAPSLDGSALTEETIDDTEGLSSGPIEVGNHDSAGSADDDLPESPQLAADTPQKIVTVRIVARAKSSFAGDELILGMRGIGLRHGKFGIFHRYEGNDENKTIFSVASLVEPGSFDLQNIKGQEIPGISIFMVLPGPIECVDAFDLMVSSARALSQALSGELLDETGSTFSIQRERYLREEIIQFQHANLVS